MSLRNVTKNVLYCIFWVAILLILWKFLSTSRGYAINGLFIISEEAIKTLFVVFRVLLIGFWGVLFQRYYLNSLSSRSRNMWFDILDRLHSWRLSWLWVSILFIFATFIVAFIFNFIAKCFTVWDTHDGSDPWTYLVFGLASVIGMIFAILVYIRLPRKQTGVKQLYKRWGEVLDRGAMPRQPSSVVICHLAPNPYHLERLSKMSLEGFNAVQNCYTEDPYAKKLLSQIEAVVNLQPPQKVTMAFLPWWTNANQPAPNNILIFQDFGNSPLGKFLSNYYDFLYDKINLRAVGKDSYIKLAFGLVNKLLELSRSNNNMVIKPLKKFFDVNMFSEIQQGKEGILVAGTRGKAYVGKFSGRDFTCEFLDISDEWEVTTHLFGGILVYYG